MKRFLIAAVVCTVIRCSAADASLVDYVNPLQGTASTRAFSHGNLYPAVCLPFPMNTWAPYTQPASDSFFYQYGQNRLRGIRQTHQPSPWIGDYGAFSLMPVSGRLVVNEDDRASVFRHETEVARPSYYRVDLDSWNATVEVTPTERCARLRFTFRDAGDAFVVLDAFRGGSSVEIFPAENKIVGVARNNRGGVPDGFANTFVIIFDRPFVAHGVWTPERVTPGGTTLSGDHVGAYLQFSPGAGPVECRVASSFISAEQAAQNLAREIGSADFATIRSRAESRWNDALGRVRVDGGLPDERRTFYSALYRTLVYPHRFYEYDARNRAVYFSPYDGRVHDGVLYTDTGFWDTFRATHPLYNLLFPEISAEILQGLLAAYDQSGWLPEWSSPGHRNCMIGNHAFSLLADGWVKGIRSFDAARAVEAMIHDARTQSPPKLDSIGRDGAAFYQQLGYVPYSPIRGEPSIREATAKTLEYAYDDFCAGVLADATGRRDDAARFFADASKYRNVFDPKVGFMRARKADGTWVEPFDPTEWGGAFTEGSSWHWTWSVMHDVDGLIALLGGDAAFAAKLDAVFTTPGTFKVGSYRNEIHEMTEMAALDLGQYAHGNEPIHHVLYLYDYVGQAWKTQSRVRAVMARAYQPTPDGLCGDEDTGQTSAWYVFSALGMYPVCPGDPTYAIGSPIFDRAVLTLPGAKTFTVSTRDNGPQHPYIRSATLNGQPLTRSFLTHEEIAAGGEVTFAMSSAIPRSWATAPSDRPQSPLRRFSRASTTPAASQP